MPSACEFIDKVKRLPAAASIRPNLLAILLTVIGVLLLALVGLVCAGIDTSPDPALVSAETEFMGQAEYGPPSQLRPFHDE
jgi:hypothetical protein